mmetsp:Transcript_14464/g.23985  ORF Transcript_14464/g.23985 Transcript_14464/m.23985 type:complete len:535 (+) Transcript_14464:74-1678(+)
MTKGGKKKQKASKNGTKKKRVTLSQSTREDIYNYYQENTHAKRADVLRKFGHITGVNNASLKRIKQMKLTPANNKIGNPKFFKERQLYFQWLKRGVFEKKSFVEMLQRRGDLDEHLPKDRWYRDNKTAAQKKMMYVEDIVVRQRRDPRAVPGLNCLLCENFNEIDFSKHPKNEELCVDIYAVYTDDESKAAADFVFLRQDIGNKLYKDRELSKTMGAGGPFRYIKKVIVSAKDTLPITFIDIVHYDDSVGSKFSKGYNLHEASDKIPRYLCWKKQGNAGNTRDVQIHYSSTEIGEDDYIAKKPGHRIMRYLVSVHSTNPSFIYALMIVAVVPLAYLIVAFEVTIGYLHSEFGQAMSDHKPPAENELVVTEPLTSELKNIVQEHSDSVYDRRLDNRIFVAYEDNKLDLYICNVFLKGIIRWGDDNNMNKFVNSALIRRVYSGNGIDDIMSARIYDTTDDAGYPLLAAIALRNKSIAHWLVKNGASLDVTEQHTNFSIQICAERAGMPIISDLVQEEEEERRMLLLEALSAFETAH